MLFPIEKNTNILPRHGKLFYHQDVLEFKQALDFIPKLLKEVNFKNDESIVFGKHYVMNRLTGWVGDHSFTYGYSQIKRKAEPWGLNLIKLKLLVEKASGYKYNSCLLNYYPSGEDGMGWHADNEKELGKNPVIASLSMGAERKFSFKHITTKEKIELNLKNGSLLIMAGEIQHFWKHTLPKTKKIKTPRMNLTFRNIIQI
ncbi:MAG: alpha-ketoglutarate-dependent dioxygenase AlkB family protein [Flavobacteriales bacterium]